MIAMQLPWARSTSDADFADICRASLILVLLAAVLMPFVSVPEPSRVEAEKVPRFVELNLAERKLPEPARPEPPPPPPEPEIAEEKPKPKPETPEPEVQVAKTPQTVQQAREVAKKSGLLAFRDELQDLREATTNSSLKETADVQRGAGEAAQLSRSLLTASTSTRNVGVATSRTSADLGGTALSGHETMTVDAPVDETAEAIGAMALVRDVTRSRSIEDVRRVFDANKGAIFAIYNRALRQDPGLVGKVVLELVIEPDGTVSACEVLSSDLGHNDLLTRLTRRVSLFDFGARDVGVTRISYPVHFLPS